MTEYDCHLADSISVELKGTFSDISEVVAAYLFGSYARGEAGNLSDVDVGILMEEGYSESERHIFRLRMMSLVSEVIGVARVDLVVMNDAPHSLAYRVIRDGILVYQHPEKKDLRVGFERDTYLRYFDFRPVETLVGEAVRERIRKGKFGGG